MSKVTDKTSWRTLTDMTVEDFIAGFYGSEGTVRDDYGNLQCNPELLDPSVINEAIAKAEIIWLDMCTSGEIASFSL